MKIHSIETENFKVDGGAMFGVVPKVLWQKLYPADENNLCPCACRSMLIQENEKNILVDAGIGNKLHPDFARHYHLFGEETLLASLKKINVEPEDITDLILTHLHFDHCGGASKIEANGKLKLTFPNAKIWVSKAQWESANNPNLREKPAYLEENLIPLKESGKLQIFEEDFYLTPNVRIRLYHGHTFGLATVFVNTGKQRVIFAGDLLPASPYIRLPYISAYDIYPLRSLDEKQTLLQEAYNNGDILFFQHDINTEACSLKQTPKGIREDKTLRLKDIA
ncbi:MAG: MBL fold metallo-hydrolase [Bacteroidales bacterium]